MYQYCVETVTSHALTRRRRVRACRRNHFVPRRKLYVDVDCPARLSFRTNFPWLCQWVVERESSVISVMVF